jgi:hypothetical protein
MLRKKHRKSRPASTDQERKRGRMRRGVLDGNAEREIDQLYCSFSLFSTSTFSHPSTFSFAVLSFDFRSVCRVAPISINFEQPPTTSTNSPRPSPSPRARPAACPASSTQLILGCRSFITRMAIPSKKVMGTPQTQQTPNALGSAGFGGLAVVEPCSPFFGDSPVFPCTGAASLCFLGNQSCHAEYGRQSATALAKTSPKATRTSFGTLMRLKTRPVLMELNILDIVI